MIEVWEGISVRKMRHNLLLDCVLDSRIRHTISPIALRDFVL